MVKETAKIRAKVIGSGVDGDPFRVNLPTYMMVPGSERYDAVDKKKLLEVDVEVPDDEVTAQGRPDVQKIRVKYRGQAKWDRDQIGSDV